MIDGTITKEDVGEQMFLKFGEEKRVTEIIKKFLADEIPSRQCWEELCASVKIKGLNELDDFIETMQVEDTFHHLVDYCESNNMKLFILSDGFDYYIKKILEKYGLLHLPFYANELSISDNRFVPSFPFEIENCAGSANCKWAHIISNSADNDFTVYVGDGYSDRHAAQFCDFIFAKSDLLKFCEINRISFYPFEDFDDVIDRLKFLKTKKRLRKRHQATLKRKEAYRVE